MKIDIPDDVLRRLMSITGAGATTVVSRALDLLDIATDAALRDEEIFTEGKSGQDAKRIVQRNLKIPTKV